VQLPKTGSTAAVIPILIEQLHTMGGTRFFVNVNRGRVPVPCANMAAS
jgi:hypothetical protein